MALDIIFISYDEPCADLNFGRLKSKYGYAKRVHGVKGVANAHFAAYELAETSLFYVVDGDAEVLPSFTFEFKPPTYDREYTHIWKSKNPVNDLEYGYGALKLFSKKMFKNLEPTKLSAIDFSTSISQAGVKYIDEVVAITHFNSDEFRAWRGAFRECAKLSSGIINGSIDKESIHRLNIWTTVAKNTAFYTDFVLDGAKAGKVFGEKYSNDALTLSKVNDFDWLFETFNSHYAKN